ncbi:MAG TPA: gephyrin-like molybdotransferase Glp [Mycobacteriales bacterium]|nr:gephyrin-like molybdotransferase Glp [Mycobacteriales bacterium]
MISYAEHLENVLRGLEPLQPLELGLMDAHGCVLAEDLVAPADLPGFDNSAMDGYAVRAQDVAGASESAPVVLPVTGDVAAGPASPLRVMPGVCVRIMTGAMVPAGADAVVPVEHTDGGVAQVAVHRPATPGQHVRRAGEDVRAGETVLPSGTHLGAVQIGLAAATGRSRLIVRPRPRVVVVSTGSELVEAGAPLEPGRIHDSNSPALTAAAHEAGAIAYRVGIVPDDPRRLADTLEDQLVRADVLVTSGGVSVGAYDVVKEVLSRLGTVRFDEVAMQPGKPQAFGTIGPDATPVFGLPGNPVSALVSFEAFVRPALRRMLGATPIERPRVRAAATERLSSPPGKRSFLRVWLEVRDGAYVVTPVSGAGSHLLAGMARANALAVVPEEVQEVPAGAGVEVLVLERRGR